LKFAAASHPNVARRERHAYEMDFRLLSNGSRKIDLGSRWLCTEISAGPNTRKIILL